MRFELTYQALAPELKVIAPWREWTLKSREDCVDYAEAHNVPVGASKDKIHSRDRNLWHLSHEGGELEDPANARLETTWQASNSPQTRSGQRGEGRDRLRAGRHRCRSTAKRWTR